MTTSIYITILGMGLVFAVIFLLWGLTALVTRLGGRLSRASDAVDPGLAEKRLAAAVAVAAALALAAEAGPSAAGQAPPVFPPPPTAIVSAWQSVTRAKTLNRKGPDR
jgi:Na+-transporting methylmalonyl-CoA/oxaloacetate decarboxylase gamma subunit